ncbi:MAG: alpha/beta hydrolase [Pusillimonas sp.]
MTGIDAPRQFSDILGIRTAYYEKKPASDTAPSPSSVVLFHGGAPGACSDLNWFRNFDALAMAGHHVIAFDQPGYGHSAVPDDHTIEFRYRHALAFLETLGLASAHLIGNSIGGLLCTLIALRRSGSQFVRSLVLAAPFPFFDISDPVAEKLASHRSRLGSIEPTFESIRELCLNTFNQPEQLTDDIINLRLSMLQNDRWSAYKARSKVSREFNRDGLHSAIVDAPTLMVWGLNDRSLPCDIGLEALQHFSNAQFMFLPRCGHWPQTEQSAIFNRTAIGFLSDQ